jgi:hypothetical protein
VSGGADVLELGPEDWAVHPAGDDLAVTPLALASTFQFHWVQEEIFAGPDDIGRDDSEYTIGDDVFQIGRFVYMDGLTVNKPSARFGNLSTGLVPVANKRGFKQESFGVEVHSVSGYSGSPVFIMRGLVGIGPATKPGNPIKLLGVCWGHVPLDEEVQERIVQVSETALGPKERKYQYVPLNSGMDLVIPAWKLKELLYLPELREMRSRLDTIETPETAKVIEDGQRDA